MPATLDVSCPNCGKALKVPTEFEGKKIKCKDCATVFPVKAAVKPARAVPAAKPAAKPAANPATAAAPPPADAEKPKSPFLDEDEEDVGPGKAPKPMGVVQESDAPRCPHCAKELDPPDAVVCTHCGFNNKTRLKAETRKVIAADAADWMTHLLPGILALIIAIALIVVDIICWVNMSDWVAGSALEKDDKDPVTGKVQYYVKPGALIAVVIALSVIIIIPAVRFAVRRLIVEYKPEERRK
jgi:hypothetical protein